MVRVSALLLKPTLTPSEFLAPSPKRVKTMVDKFLVAVLQKHWIAADSIDFHLRRSMNGANYLPLTKIENPMEFAETFSLMQALQVHYALLYVVVEGYKEIGCTDDTVDALLGENSYLDQLRLFRNAVFHFQKEPFSDKLVGFLREAGSETWVKNLNRALEAFFEKELDLKRVAEGLGFEKKVAAPAK